MGAAYVSNGLLIERKLAEETFWIIAFAAAYLFDVSKLNPAK
ncbi:hypothetical protein RAN3_2528 [plant metagenome]|uniref:Uncharacterized protein n=1 Tax=plant metagenome TaxID=1297885 RepID=A0A484U539_9ZZZZ